MDNKEEKVEVESKSKKKNIGFTLFACLMTGVIVFLATNLGQKASKIVEPDTNSASNKVEEKVDSNNVEAQAENSNITSNTQESTTKQMTSEEKFAIYSKNRQARIAKMKDNRKEGEPDFSGYLYGENEKIRINYKGEVQIYQPASKKYVKIFNDAIDCGMVQIGNGGENYLIWVVANNGNVYLKEVEIINSEEDLSFKLEKSDKYKNIVYGVHIGSSGGHSVEFIDIDGNSYKYQ